MADLNKMDRTWLCRVVFMDTAAYTLRASAEEASGDASGAAADRRHVRETRQNKSGP